MQAKTLESIKILHFYLMTAHEFFNGFGFVVDGKTIDQCRARFIQADHFYLGPFAAKFNNDFIKCGDGSDIPKMGTMQIDGDFIYGFLKIEAIGKLFCRRKKYLTYNLVATMLAILRQRRCDVKNFSHFARKKQCAQ